MFPSFKRPSIKRSADDSDDWARKNFEEMRSRHPMFRMPDWMSEDDDMSNLASRMSQSPHFATTTRRGGPWRERRNSGGGAAMSGPPEDMMGDSVDGPHRHHSTPIQIPIRIEAEAPPGCIASPPLATASPEHNKPKDDSHCLPNDPPHELRSQQPSQIATEPPQLCVGQLRKQPQYASRTTSAVNAISQDDVPRDARAASAPPDMADPLHPHKYVYKMKVPQSDKSPLGSSPVFNNVPKPYFKVAEEKTPIQEEEPTVILKPSSASQPFTPQYNEAPPAPPQPKFSSPPQPQPQHNNYQPQWGSGSKSSVIRNIPILIEGRDEGNTKPPMQESHPPSDWDHTFGSPSSFRFPTSQEPHKDPFFDLPSKMSGHQMPPHQMPPHQMPPHQMPPHQMPPHQMPPHQMPPHQMPPHQMPPHQMPQNYHPSSGNSFDPPQETAPQQSEQQTPHADSTPKMEENTPPTEPVDRKMETIAHVRKSVTEYQEQIKKFTGVKTDKEYIYLDEMLTRALLQLDNIDPDGRDDVRQARKTLVKDINDTIVAMEKMSRSGVSKGPEPQDTEMNNCPPIESAEPPIEESGIEIESSKLEAPCSNSEEVKAMDHDSTVKEIKNDSTDVEPMVDTVTEPST